MCGEPDEATSGAGRTSSVSVLLTAVVSINRLSRYSAHCCCYQLMIDRSAFTVMIVMARCGCYFVLFFSVEAVCQTEPQVTVC